MFMPTILTRKSKPTAGRPVRQSPNSSYGDEWGGLLTSADADLAAEWAAMGDDDGTRRPEPDPTLADFMAYMTQGRFHREPRYGAWSEGAAVVRFFDTPRNEELLADIRTKNAAEGMGAVRIPGTRIELVNFSVCPACGESMSLDAATRSWADPPRIGGLVRGRQLREDARLPCAGCGALYLPALVVVDGSPRNECQMLCRLQTVNAIEGVMALRGRPVLSRRRENVIHRRRRRGAPAARALRNDVRLGELKPHPGLISNLLLHTPPGLMGPLIAERNVARGDPIFGAWF